MSEITLEKPRYRVQAGSVPVGRIAGSTPKHSMRYLNRDRTGVLSMRRAVRRDGAAEVREAALRASALAFDFMQNSGWIAGACDQMIVDTIGTELKLNARPDLSRLGYSDEERSAWCKLVEAEWRRWSWNPRECDLAGKSTIAEMCDGLMRYYIGAGEGFGIISFFGEAQRRAYGVQTGTKVNLVAPHRVPNITREFEGLDGGIFHDANGRPTHCRFKRRDAGIDVDYDLPFHLPNGLAQVIHVLDRGDNPDSPRGISVMAPILKVIAQSDQLADATLATALLQTIFAAVIKSPEPSEEAFQAIQTLADTGGSINADGLEQLVQDFVDVWGARFEALKSGGINLSDTARIGHLGPGEELEFKTAATPGSQYLPFNQNLQREMARRLGVTMESFSMDFSSATYSSVRVATATVHPIAQRRRERVAAPFCQSVYEAWLDEKIALGAIPFKGGYRAFAANRDKVCWTEWQGPAKPSADDYKSANAAKVRLETGVSSLADECAEYGRDWEEVAAQRERELKVLADKGLPNPFERIRGGGGESQLADDPPKKTQVAA
ncbi:phage portal protein [Pseudorhizobium halotolerans]|uniref:Phage portal protein n=1 Tax=Pseudorhizobium halotolerans TaxID=1233081 RepID=A0ABN7JMU5_9HYPH|nr:phage portal protein [Pseudorhizobium halotolerans]CAD7036475.1 phage portal protein [Pseudorhizobium halotolerans]